MSMSAERLNRLSGEVIGAAIEVHRALGPGLVEGIYERCLLHELELRRIATVKQREVSLRYKDLVIAHSLRFDLLVEDLLLVELKAVEVVHPVARAQLLSYMKMLGAPLGLLINFHEARLVDGICRMILAPTGER